ncbi:MAG: CAP domain-containing protein [Eubacteriales bacterium]|nr:CAP domain-containing protein [Eubacteriales bacterium]
MGEYMKRITFISLFFVLILSCGMRTEAADSKIVQVSVEYGQTEARSMLPMVNEFRQGTDAWYWNSDNRTQTTCTKLPALVYDYELERIAMQRAVEIALLFDHTRPDGTICFTAYSSAYGYSAENIAMGYGSATSTFNQWKEDGMRYDGQGHRRNMLSDKATSIGIGHVYYNGRHYWVQEFGNKAVDVAADPALDDKKVVDVTVANANIESLTPVKNIKFSLANGTTMKLPDAEMLLVMKKNTSESMNTPCPVQLPATWTVKDLGIASVSGKELTAKGIGTTTLSNSVWGTAATATVEVYCAHNEVTDPAVPATCVMTGLTEGTHCDKCGKVLVEQTKVPETGHQWDGGQITIVPKEGQPGMKLYTCTQCSATKEERLPALAIPVAKPLKVGTVIKSRKDAQYIVTKATDSAREVKYVKPVNKKAAKVAIPATIKVDQVTYKVTVVGASAFKNNQYLTSITIGKNIKKIEKKAFYGCSKLKKVKISSVKVTSIGDHAFQKIHKKVKYTMPVSKKNKYIRMLKKASK